MAQSAPVAPSVVMNAAGDRKQVPLRDYLNARVAPFLKKAITQSLDAEAEYPLQWLGECLINQSMLYEGNPDSTGIREKFRYNFDGSVQKTVPDESLSSAQSSAHPETNGTNYSAPPTLQQPPAPEPIPQTSIDPPIAPQQNGSNAAESEVKESQGEPIGPQDTEMTETS